MKREMDLVRTILLAMEQDRSEEGTGWAWPEGYPVAVVQYHLRLMAQAGLIAARGTEGAGVVPAGLTWQGHEFLEGVREETAWRKAKATVQERGEAMTFEVLKAVVSGLVRAHLGGP